MMVSGDVGFDVNTVSLTKDKEVFDRARTIYKSTADVAKGRLPSWHILPSCLIMEFDQARELRRRQTGSRRDLLRLRRAEEKVKAIALIRTSVSVPGEKDMARAKATPIASGMARAAVGIKDGEPRLTRYIRSCLTACAHIRFSLSLPGATEFKKGGGVHHSPSSMWGETFSTCSIQAIT